MGQNIGERKEMKTKYYITYHASTGKVENTVIEASSVRILKGTEADLVCWMVGKRTVFAIPYRSLIHTGVAPPRKQAEISLKICR